MDPVAEEVIRSRIRDIPDYPKKGILFKDITPLLKDRNALAVCINELAKAAVGLDADYIVGTESRGFIIGAALAYRLNVGFVPARKQGRLPYDKVSRTYDLEYGTATLEMHRDAVERGSRVLIVDDLLATGGTARATADLVGDLGGKVTGFAFVVELAGLGGRERLGGSRVISLIRY
jgi:adenine phosphoribosyltransferase